MGQNQIIIFCWLYFCRGQIKFQLCAEILLCLENVYEVVEFFRAHLYKEVFLQTELITNVGAQAWRFLNVCELLNACAQIGLQNLTHTKMVVFLSPLLQLNTGIFPRVHFYLFLLA
jgi:hypothetical protein